MFEANHVYRRRIERRALGLGSWLGCRGGVGRGGVFAVGISGQAVVVGMECYRCHLWYEIKLRE